MPPRIGQWTRKRRLAAVRDRLRRIADTGDHSVALEPRALPELEKLAALLHRAEADHEVQRTVGLMHFCRYTARAAGAGRTGSAAGAAGVADTDDPDYQAAVRAFRWYFSMASVNFPKPCSPTWPIPGYGRPSASARGAPTIRPVAPWPRTCGTASSGHLADHPRRTARLRELGSTLRDRFGLTGALSDIGEAIDRLREAQASVPCTTPRSPRGSATPTPRRTGPLISTPAPEPSRTWPEHVV